MSKNPKLNNCLPEYLDSNVFTIRKCPKCNSNHYKRTIVDMVVREYKNHNLVTQYKPSTDAGSHFMCMDCGLDIAQDGSWEINHHV